MKKGMIILFIVCFSVSFTALGQQAFLEPEGPQPEVGKPMPDFTLSTVTHYTSSRVALKDFKGKWLFLDFWFTGCINCIKSMPKISALQQEFEGVAVFLLVGMNDQKYNKGIEALFERLREKQNLKIPAAYDSILINRWNIHSMPHIIIIDPKGIVRAITDGRDLNKEKIRGLISNEPISFFQKDKERPEFDASKTDDESVSDSNLLFRSVLTKWNGEDQLVTNINEYVKQTRNSLKDGYQIVMVPLFALYNQAYIGQWLWNRTDSLYGKFYPRPILELQDSSLFEFDYKWELGKGTYNYSLTVPPTKINRGYMMGIMQQDLKNIFGYEVSIENREMTVWKLVTLSNETKDKLKSKGSVSHYPENFAAGFAVKNFPIKNLIDIVVYYISDNEPPFIDLTGMVGNIDITLDADMTNREEVRKALRLNGLDLIKGSMKMNVVVIREPSKKLN